MSHPYRSRSSRDAHPWARSQSIGSIPLANRDYKEPNQPVEHHDIANDNGERCQRSRNERGHRPLLRDRRVQTDAPSHITRAIEWTVSANQNGAEDSLQVTTNDGYGNDYEGDDESDGNYDETDDESQTGRRPLRTPAEQLPGSDPPIAKFVRSQAQRRSSYGRAFFSPSGLQNGETGISRYGRMEYPLLRISSQHCSPPLSQAALDLAEFRSGDFRPCVQFLREHENLLHEDYYPYLQEAWKALWDDEKTYAHQCLSRWFLLDECRRIWPRDIGKHINQRTFSGPQFLDKVDDMYKTLKTLRQDVLREMGQATNGAPHQTSSLTSSWPLKNVRSFFKGIEGAKVMNNAGIVYRLAKEVRRELKGNKTEL